ncbi:MAG: hypothetical protein KDC61_19865 [Saprospiraceae bacterium]|nr:hypothetical protein [Saprospiraceae bacterium]MCB0542655.1 hypothetical protein [Saprospiraceae bacterium]MCB0576826.1 hypothetical protein [Saprospiraceae bacterium]MCB9354300.1 hypothetical protein [Lewinellaceae bacterium]
MKKEFLCLVFGLFIIANASAQIYVEGVRLTPDNTGQYIELDPKFRSDGRCTFIVDYGQSNAREDYVTDEHGKRYDFRSLVDGLNVFYQEGWEVFQITVMEESGRRYLLKRRY